MDAAWRCYFRVPGARIVKSTVGMRLDGINWRESAVPLTERITLLIDSFCLLERACSNIMGDRLNTGAAVLLAQVGGNQAGPDIGESTRIW
jgi:hypothetical protein